ncbi:MAG: phosphoribosylglycinamide formyltransferase [Bacteroidales bacterium]|jgi:phosphoribosylglycinamide formyltransferase-1|nr:phosphoribosylglycinamide formyltransferase [Bacteroidales bacterium]
MKRLAVFVSGGGTNLQRIADYFAPNPNVEIVCVVSNNKGAFANQRAKNLGIPLLVVEKEYYNSEMFIKRLISLDIDLIVLAGFLWLIPQGLIEAFPNKIINIHPALLPKYGGKGFYGHHVHEAVVAAHEKESGITVHYVNERYDSGDIIFQAKVALSPTDTPDDVAAKIHVLEQENFPLVIEGLLFKK